MKNPSLLHVSGLNLDAPGGRPLFRDLNLSMGRERVALIGRNGSGKSSLLEVLAGIERPSSGRVLCTGTRLLVPQQLRPAHHGNAMSPGERRKACLEEARLARPELLLLDEPTQDLDGANTVWLENWLSDWRAGLIVVSHDRRLLPMFRDFFIVAESGCRYFRGTFGELERELERENVEGQKTYVRNLHRLVTKEQHNATVRRRRQRKKNVGRVREIGRMPSRERLNANRSYAQESQGKRWVLQKNRIGAMREWARATRRALAVDLPLEVVMPPLPEERGLPIVSLESVAARAGDRVLFQGLDLQLGRDRLAITGCNGAGKTTLLRIMVGDLDPASGSARCTPERFGVIAQHASNWASSDSLLDHLLTSSNAITPRAAAKLLLAHKFPFALAERPMASLSPGERVRAALICLFQRRPAIELVLLDEPTDQLDFAGASALRLALRVWPGGLVVVSHDMEFLQAIGIAGRIDLDAPDLSERREIEPVEPSRFGTATGAVKLL